MTHLDFLNTEFPVRRTPLQKRVFREYISTLPSAGRFGVRTEETSDGKNYNIVIGDPQSARVVFTAHYDTPAAAVFPNLMIPRNRFLFWSFQLLPLIVIIALSLGGGYISAAITKGGRETFFIGFLFVYYLLYFLMYRTFTNKCNHNDNTSGVAAVLSLADRADSAGVAFVLFDNEEKGKKGSKAYFKDHKDFMQSKLLINFDCVGNGNNIVFIAKKDAEASKEWQILNESVEANEAFSVCFYPLEGSESNSDYKNFPLGIGCMACKRTKHGVLYTPYIHTSRDRVAHNENIDFIAEAMDRFIKRI